jgi:hypothetical protein
MIEKISDKTLIVIVIMCLIMIFVCLIVMYVQDTPQACLDFFVENGENTSLNNVLVVRKNFYANTCCYMQKNACNESSLYCEGG